MAADEGRALPGDAAADMFTESIRMAKLLEAGRAAYSSLGATAQLVKRVLEIDSDLHPELTAVTEGLEQADESLMQAITVAAVRFDIVRERLLGDMNDNNESEGDADA